MYGFGTGEAKGVDLLDRSVFGDCNFIATYR